MEREKLLDMESRYKLVKVMAERYKRARKKDKGYLLDFVVNSSGYSRCYAGWLLRNIGRRVVVYDRGERIILVGSRRKSQRGIRKRPIYYDRTVLDVLRRIWLILDCPCGKRLAPYLKEILPVLEREEEIMLDRDIRDKILCISASSIDRLLREERKKWEIKKKRKGYTKPGVLTKHNIAIRTFADWDEKMPGFVEMDLVDHSGGVERGIFAQTLDITDVFTGWTETIAVANKSQSCVFAGIDSLRKSFPFQLLGIDSDNGSEFINDHLQKYCRDNKITFTRSRPYKKNDSCYVEQKNWSVVRKTVGYLRYETEEEVKMLNLIYNKLRLYTNFFQPQMKCKEKVRIGSKVKKQYDEAKTPYQRIIEYQGIDEKIKQNLKDLYNSLNPVALKKEIVQLQEKLYNIALQKPFYQKRVKDVSFK